MISAKKKTNTEISKSNSIVTDFPESYISHVLSLQS